MSVTDEIKARLDIVEVVGGYVPLKKAGRTFKANCPFHQEKTPSFVVNPDRQTWHCFGACSTGGDIFTFIQKAENVDFAGALKILAQRAGVELAPRNPEAQQAEDQRQRLYDIHAAAVQFFHSQLCNSPAAAPVRAYLQQRQVDDAARDRFQLGYALDSWDSLLLALTARGFRPEDIALAGLAVEREGGTGHYDRFRARLMFPIQDERGRVIGFGGRALGDALPKYLNSPQTPLFDKSESLYGLNLARDTIRRSGVGVVVEGYMDVVSLHQRGFHNVVASLGTALTEAQVALASRYATTLVLALDADTAGNAATLRGLQVAARAVATHKRRVPGPGGSLQTVDKRTVELRITVLPLGMDPDDLVKQNPAEWERRVAASQPVPDYYFTALVSDLDLRTATGKEEAVSRLLQVIRDELAGPVEQAHYIQWLARLTRVDERQLTQRFRNLGRTRQPANSDRRPPPVVAPATRRSFGAEEYLLTLLLPMPSTLSALQVQLAGLDMPALAESDFNAADNQALCRSLLTDENVALTDTLDSHREFLLQSVANRPALGDEMRVREAVITTLRLRENQRRQELAQLEFLLADAKSEGDTIASTRYALRVQHISTDLERIKRALIQTQRSVVLSE